jgi:hypothetical protein
VGYQASTFYGRELNDQEHLEWGAAFALGERTRQEIKGRELSDYVSQLDRVRATTLAELSRRDDSWLEEEATFGVGVESTTTSSGSMYSATKSVTEVRSERWVGWLPRRGERSWKRCCDPSRPHIQMQPTRRWSAWWLLIRTTRAEEPSPSSLAS